MTRADGFRWPEGRQCAVSLTYDDALTVHHELVAPFLSAQGLTATFNVVANPGFTENTDVWKRVAEQGHELGNHSLFHPCRREPSEQYAWLSPQYDLCQYTRQRWFDELRVANCLLRMIDGRRERTFGNTCCHTTIGQGEGTTRFDDLMAKLFVAARGPLNNTVIRPDTLCYTALGHFSGDARTSWELQQWVEQAQAQGGWIIVMIHGVGAGTHKFFIDQGEHDRFVKYLAGLAGQVWTASMVEVAGYLKQTGYAAVS